jgi:hypothetical protein
MSFPKFSYADFFAGFFAISKLLKIHQNPVAEAETRVFHNNLPNRCPGLDLRDFLNGVAEIFAFAEPSDDHLTVHNVAATAFVLDVSTSTPYIHITKNEGCKHEELDLANSFQKWLRGMSTSENRSTTSSRMFDMNQNDFGRKLVQFHVKSIDFHIKNVQKTYEADMIELFTNQAPCSEEALTLIKQFKGVCQFENEITEQGRRTVLEKAFGLRCNEDAMNALHMRDLNRKTFHGVPDVVYILGGYYKAYMTFKKTVQTARNHALSFKSVKVMCIETTPKKQTFSSSKILSSIILWQPSIIWSCGHRKYVRQLQRHNGRSTTISHAEIQLINHLEGEKLPSDHQPYAYLGCSKSACWLCYQFISEYRSAKLVDRATYSIRGCHGEIFPLWQTSGYHGLDEHELYRCLGKIRENMLRLLRMKAPKPTLQKRPHVPRDFATEI